LQKKSFFDKKDKVCSGKIGEGEMGEGEMGE
jgi:hypothetical protein